VLVVIETDTIAIEVEAPAAGRLTAVLVNVGETAPVGAALARWELADGQTAVVLAPASTLEAPPAQPATGPVATLTAPASPAVTATSIAPGGRLIATPYARRLARERDVPLAGLAGSGPGGRIRAADVPAHAAVLQPVATRRAAPETGALLAAPDEHFLLADVPAAALLDWRVRLPAGYGGIGSLVFYLAARVLLAHRPHARCAAGDGAALPAAVAAQGFTAWRAALQAVAGAGAPATLWFASAGRGPLRVRAPARPTGCELALGLGSVTDDSITLSLRADAAAWSAADAATYLSNLRAALEDPRRVLL
jgi:pyruvate/2-oxoglutarate dehydrogenase complex dihydrolipoamide acyltransferase (E2) component